MKRCRVGPLQNEPSLMFNRLPNTPCNPSISRLKLAQIFINLERYSTKIVAKISVSRCQTLKNYN